MSSPVLCNTLLKFFAMDGLECVVHSYKLWVMGVIFDIVMSLIALTGAYMPG